MSRSLIYQITLREYQGIPCSALKCTSVEWHILNSDITTIVYNGDPKANALKNNKI